MRTRDLAGSRRAGRGTGRLGEPVRDLCERRVQSLVQVALMDPTICTRNGGTPFDVFISELQRNKFAGAWRFSAPHVNISAGSSLTVENRGGETHTFTQVTQFGGGGIVEPLNEILFGTPTPLTFFFGPFNFIPAGAEVTISSSTLTPGTHLFLCAIHPWMEETVVVD
jgi:plastocyanin